MDLTLIVKDNCSACSRVELALRNLANSNKDILFSVINIKDYKEFKTQIVPALFINQELLA